MNVTEVIKELIDIVYQPSLITNAGNVEQINWLIEVSRSEVLAEFTLPSNFHKLKYSERVNGLQPLADAIEREFPSI